MDKQQDHVARLKALVSSGFDLGLENEDYAALSAAISALTVDEARPRCGDERYELDAYIWKRESTQEWVLELSGTIGDAHFISRHCEPLTTPPEDVAGLPSMYAAIQGESRD